MKTVLFYGPFNSRSRDTETLMLAMKKDGFKVLFLTQYEGKEILPFLKSNGIESYSSGINGKEGKLVLLKQVYQLNRFCHRHNVEVIFSHLEPGNFVAVLANIFIRARLFVCRHHSDLYALMKRDQDFSYRFTYKNAPGIIVLSRFTKQHMVETENVPEEKINVIPLAYDFSLYRKPDSKVVERIREQYKADILLITVGRLDEYKRSSLSIDVVRQLVERGIDAKLVIAGSGELLQALQTQVINSSLSDRVFFTGYVNNALDYVNAADFVLHPSISEASCVVIKEAGLVRKPVVVCSGVGDFEDYIVNRSNGFLVSKDRFVQETVALILENHSDKDKLKEIGTNLGLSVLEKFTIENVYPLYQDLLKRT